EAEQYDLEAIQQPRARTAQRILPPHLRRQQHAQDSAAQPAAQRLRPPTQPYRPTDAGAASVGGTPTPAQPVRPAPQQPAAPQRPAARPAPAPAPPRRPAAPQAPAAAQQPAAQAPPAAPAPPQQPAAPPRPAAPERPAPGTPVDPARAAEL